MALKAQEEKHQGQNPSTSERERIKAMDYQTQVQVFENNSKNVDEEKQLLPLNDLQLAFVGGGSGDVIHG